MSKIVFTIVFIFLQTSINPNYDYAEIFEDDFVHAINFFTNNKAEFEKTFSENNIDLAVIIPTIFPEKVRYSIFKNFVEVMAIQLAYVEYGSEMIDCSIGDFQIKPSFAEHVEKDLLLYPDLKTKYAYLQPQLTNELEVRKARLELLKTLEGQIQYLSAFYDLMHKKYSFKNKSSNEKILFFAAAYNTGYWKPEAAISEAIEYKYFPYGRKYKGEQYQYSDVSLYFYQNYFKTIF